MKTIIFVLFLIINCSLVQNQRYLQNLNPNLFGNPASSGGVKTFTKTKSVKTLGASSQYNIGHNYGASPYASRGQGNYGQGQFVEEPFDSSGYRSQHTKSSILYKGGCSETPKPPVQSTIKCSQYSGCRVNCLENHQFPNGEKQLFVTCENGEWVVKGTEWDTIPPCEPICTPPCQNNGICIAPNQCNCPENFAGPLCEYENKPCVNMPPMPMNAKRRCKKTSCTVTCVSGHKFPDGSSVANMVCKNGNWVPAREDWAVIPDCSATCNPPCENGGICLALNVCQCPTEFRGPQCQHSVDNCNSRKLMFNGGYNCTGNSDSYLCSVVCPEGVPFEFEPAPVYTCNYDTGLFLPTPIPQCIYEEGVQVIHVGGQNLTSYQTTNEHVISNKSTHHYFNVTETADYNVKPGACFTWGGSHLKTFDGKVFSFSSKCAHVLVRDAADDTFTVIVKNNPACEENSKFCFKDIKIYLHNEEYALSKTANGVPTFASKKKVLHIPVRMPGIRVDTVAHYIIVYLDSIGVKLRWDGYYMVQVEVKENLWNRTAGLCGRFDGEFNNDMLTKEGGHPKSTVTLARSWQVDTLEEPCNFTPTEEHACADLKMTGTKGNKASQFCKKILSDKRFSACRKGLDSLLLLETCRWDYCACKDPDPTVCACDTLNIYVRECAHKGLMKLTNWRDDDMCPMQCTGGRVYMTCGPKGGQEVCGASVERTNNDECEEGCYCPPGMVLHENQCITRDQCPCQLRTKSFSPGSTIPKDCNTCTCVDGQWVCTQVNCGARCAAIGDPHYTTFDGKRYDFMGQCSYYLLYHEDFTIEAENVACAGSISQAMNFPVSISAGLPSCTKTVTIKIKDHVIKLKQNQEISINGVELESLPLQLDDIAIRSASSLFVVVELPEKVQVWWDGVTRAYIDVPATYKGKTKGLCGTFNENQKDDFLTPDDDIENAVIPFANKWKTNEKCVDVPVKTKPHPCDENVQNRAKAEEYCKKIKSPLFADCHWIVDPEQFYQDCLYDMCSCEAKVSKCLCPIIAAYAHECAQQTIKVDWRLEVKECGVQCSGGQIYQVCGNSCTRSCYDIATRPDCKQHCVEGCNCPEGQALDENGECIPIGSCSCQHEGLEFPAGYKEIRPASKGLELCTCVNAMWNCRLALPTDAHDYPRANDLKGKCNTRDNFEFTTCEPVEPKTCKNMHRYQPTSNRVCHPGCQCKKGYVLDTYTKKCVKPHDCACHHGGKSYKEGVIVQHDCNECKCFQGKWKCTTKTCPAECSAWGDSHFKTFDGKLYDYQGQCDYVLAKGSLGADSFDVTIQNVPCGSLGVACSKSVTIKVGDESLTLTRGKQLPQYQILKRITVREKNIFVIVEAPDLGLIIHWDKGTRVYVKVDPRWKSKVKGLCGNYNDNEIDDFQTPSGGITEASARIFGDSWKLQSYCPDALEITDTCDERPDRRVWALKKCGILKSEVFAPCHSEVSVESYFDRCVFDTCACDQGGDCECLCTALAAYAQECNAKGVPIKWRSQQLCPMQCDENCSKYSPCVSTCPIETCENLLVQSPLNKLCKEEVCIEGCQPKLCPKDHVYVNSSYLECVPKSVCKPFCMEIDDTSYFEGDVIEEDDCHTCYCSRGKKVCKGFPCTTTAIPPTQPDQSQQMTTCSLGWSAWINQDKLPEGKLDSDQLKESDIEPLPSTLLMYEQDGIGKCAANQMVRIECRTVKDHIPAKETGLDVECSLENGLICRSKNGRDECEDFEIRVLCGCDKSELVIDEEKKCPPGKVYDPCVIECDNLCSIYGYIIKQKQLCPNNTQCQPGCVTPGQKVTCSSDMKRLNDHTCVKEEDCICSTPNGIAIKPGTVYKASECEVCQCIHNEITCDTDSCKEDYVSIISPEAETELEEEIEKEFEPVIKANESYIVVISTVTPPTTCDEDRYIDLVQGDQPLPDEAFSASSTLGKLYAPHNARFTSNVTEKSAGNWAPSKLNKKQYLNIDLGRVEPIYGVVVKGSSLYDEYVTSYYVLYSQDGTGFHVIRNKKNKPKKFRGSADTNTPVKAMFDVPIEAKIIRLNPRTWHKGIALKVELIGCEEPTTTVTTSRPILCTDSMGFSEGLMSPQQVSVSSELNDKVGKNQIAIDGPSAWQPLSNTPTEWIKFNFLEPRFITGVSTQGGPNGWVKTYKVTYSKNGYDWNPILDENLNEKVFLGNVDTDTIQTNYFNLPIQAIYLNVVPLKWEKNIQMRIEPYGCFEPYPTLPEVLTTAKPSPCNFCPDVEPIEMELDACRCAEGLWWDGENCVARNLCPCMVGHIPYAVGTVYETEDCSQCICKIGGVPYCTPKVCEKCEKGLRSVVTSTCGCVCQPCDEGTILCPTSNVCINATLWCNKIQDCPDDELNCITTTPEPETTTLEISEKQEEKRCPVPSCPPGYKVVMLKADKKKYHKLSTMFSKGQHEDQYVASKTKNSGVKGGSKKKLQKPYVDEKEKPAVEECPQFQCVSIRKPPDHLTSQPCPPVSCPPGYTLEYDHLDVALKERCPKYECQPPPLPDIICNITGTTFNTFDRVEYRYDICKHVLARDIDNDIWDVTLKKICKDNVCERVLIIQHEDHIIELYPSLTVYYDGFKYTVDQTKKIGHQSKAFTISRLGDMLLFVSNRYGFWAMLDKQGNVKLGVAANLMSKVDGLCGYYNGNPDDDKRKPDGTPARTTVEFGDSWAVNDEPLLCETKICPIHIQTLAWDICSQAKNDIFSPCAKAMDVEAFISRCLESTCSCLEAAENNKTTTSECRCQALTNFVTDCLTADNNLELLDWRTKHDCPVECKAPLIHHDCYRRKCELTCETIGDPNVCPKIPNICFPGCYCPPGYVKKGETCIKSSDCRDCECNVLPHLQYVDYVDNNFTVNGNCVYVMSRDISTNQEHKFQVLITNHPCEDRPSKTCVGKVTILYNGHKIHIIMDDVGQKLRMIVDSEVIYDYKEISDIAKIKVTSSKHLKIFFDDIHLQVNVYYPSLGTSIKAPSHKYKGKLEGLCGDCNKGTTTTKDFKMPSGKFAQDTDEFALSWLYDGIFGQSPETCANKPKPRCDFTIDNNPCLILRDSGRFGQCHPLLEPSMFIEWCQNDVCESEVSEACKAISAYARECLNAGFCVNWHSDLCPAATCPLGQIFQQCGSSCPATCERLKDNDNKKCQETPTEGCFCAEGLYLKNDTCVEKEQCEVCDLFGHHSGEVWKEDACTTCSCIGTALICETQSCPAIDGVCEPGFNPIKVPANKGECCDRVICSLPEAGTSAPCEELVKINCAPGQIMTLDTKPNGCKQFVCQCKPIEDCEEVDISPPTEPGMIKEIDRSGCCPEEKLVCKPELCPPPPECPQFYEVQNTNATGVCCPIYTCKAPDNCIFESEYTASETGGERLKNVYEKQKLLKEGNDTWKDGPCRECKCMGDQNKGFHSICSVQECPDLNSFSEAKDYVLKPEYVVNQCCPNLKRVACILEGKTYEIGEKWHPKDDFCTTVECVLSPTGLEKNTQVTTCDQTCEIGWEYVPPTAHSMECCGFCKQTACVIDGTVRRIGEEWSSSDYCTNYVCSNVNGSLQVQAQIENCPNKPGENQSEYVYETKVVDGKCCKEYKIVACKEEDIVYKVGEVWPSPDGDLCKKITCIKNNLGELTKQELIESCNKNCSKGWEYVESNATCCGECVQVACVVNDVLKGPGENWTSADSCTTYTCEKDEHHHYTVSSFYETCPNVDDCPEENVYSKGCCKYCNVTALSQSNCVPVDIEAAKTVGLVKTTVHQHGVCVNKEKIPNFSECVGNCHSSTFYNAKSGRHESICTCCQATKYLPITVTLTCEDGVTIERNISVPSVCSCESCLAEKSHKNTKGGGGGVKTG